jgi:phospholipase/carboxylesterase
MATETYIYSEVPGVAGGDLFFVFHGTGGDETQFTSLARDLLPDAHVISPRGDVSEHGALRFFKRKAEGVYDLDDLALRTANMAHFISTHQSRLKPRRTIGLGYSNGANILASVMFQNGQLFNAAVLMHPLIPFSPPQQTASARVLISAGRRDPICPPALTQALAAYFGATLEWHDGGHEIRTNEIEAARQFLSVGAT